MELTYRWIHDEFTARYTAKTAHKSSISTFTKGSHPIPGDGYNPSSQRMDTWKQGIPAGYGAPKKRARKARIVKRAKAVARKRTA
jgi:hypothetical protein